MEIEDKVEDFTFLSINSKKVKVLVIGGGKAALIKAKSFLRKGFVVHCIAPNFNEEFLQLNYETLKLIVEEFKDEIVKSYHIVVICTNKEELNRHIRVLCDEEYKVYIDATMPEESMATLCAMTSTKEVSVGVRIKGKSPKTSQFLANKVKQYLMQYDDYVFFATHVRNNIGDFHKKSEVLEFISSEDFLFFFEKHYGEEILNLFYGGFDFELKISYEKK
jgi:precorrin-2 dehydrogenase / sirohydrochlorin ferrochelatase